MISRWIAISSVPHAVTVASRRRFRVIQGDLFD